MSAGLEVRDLDVAYGGVSAVRGLSLDVRPGEIVGLIGPNGAGKSTTLHAIMGLVPATAGEMTLAGRSLRGRAPETIARSGIALVPEGRRLFAELTVEENLRLGLAGRSGSDGVDADLEAIRRALPRRCGVPGIVLRALSPVASNSSSRSPERSSPQPSILLLDEPSLGSPRPWSISSSRRCRRSASAASVCSSSSSELNARSRSPTGRTCSQTASYG